jgi:hypothetical protein
MVNMKKITKALLTISLLTTAIVAFTSCKKNLLEREPTTELAANSFWKTESDATAALMGAYASTRPVFDRDYY